MRRDRRSGAGGVATASCHQASCPGNNNSGSTKVAQEEWKIQQPDVARAANQLQRRYRLPPAFARIFTEARCRHD
jgi:hypothetical protein